MHTGPVCIINPLTTGIFWKHNQVLVNVVADELHVLASVIVTQCLLYCFFQKIYSWLTKNYLVGRGLIVTVLLSYSPLQKQRKMALLLKVSTCIYDRACHSGGICWNYYPGAHLQITAAHLKIGCPVFQ